MMWSVASTSHGRNVPAMGSPFLITPDCTLGRMSLHLPPTVDRHIRLPAGEIGLHGRKKTTETTRFDVSALSISEPGSKTVEGHETAGVV